jgi:hypothetical protein
MKNLTLIILVLLALPNNYSFSQNYKYSNLGVFYFKGGNSFTGKSTFLNLHLLTENSFNLSKNLSFGLSYNYSKNSVNYDNTGSIYLNGLLPLKNILFFTGVGASYGQKMYNLDGKFQAKSGFQVLGQGGIRFKIKNIIFGQFEVGNFRYDSGLVPTIGIGIKH